MNTERIIETFDSFISNDEFLIEKDWLKFVPNKITYKGEKGKHTSTFTLRDSSKNLNSVDLIYNLDESTTERTSTTLNINLTFKFNNTIQTPIIDNTFETVVEITLGTRYILGVKVMGDRQIEFIPRVGTLDNNTLESVSKLIEYISDGHLKANFK